MKNTVLGTSIPSPYPELLLSSTVPLDSQVPVILSAIQAAQEDIRATENEVGDDVLKQRRSALEEFVQIHRSMVSVIRRLPSEILSEIFSRCSRKWDGCKPRIFATVCSRWRDVALATPRLWCNVWVDREEVKPQSLSFLLSLQLERSGQVPLSVVFSDPFIAPCILESLIAVSHRWESVDLVLTGPQRELIHSSNCHFPILKRLILQTPSLELGNLSRPLPLLEELSLDGRYFSDDNFELIEPLLIPPQFPWTGFTKCSLVQCTAADVLNILRASPPMEDLSLGHCYGPSERDQEPIPTTSNIRSLNIRSCNAAFTREFFPCFSAPNLQELLVDDAEAAITTTALVALLAGPSPQITHLRLSRVRASEKDLIVLLRVADAVEHLEISWPWDVHSNTLMEALTLLPGNRNRARPRILPKLRLLSITGGLACKDESLLTMLESRCPGLKHVELFYAGRTFFFDRSFDGLRKAGMEIDVRFDAPVDSLGRTAS
ncbi:hypothetical protein B0H17DRAFT_1032367 [Mycena rosella]|uniref:F-box domain-containing protein n=1 Tax=Mycena rosella TaxID=1033263 RepID=A0AAD7M9V6_MYCRO|nr:hypothetical protein B0H17DRAFT_1032367 [Mycena rosella]